MNNTQQFKAEELCSSKLWEIVSAAQEEPSSKEALDAAVAELANRRHYLNELKELGVFDNTPG